MARRVAVKVGAGALGLLVVSTLFVACGGGTSNDSVAREALVQASLKSAAAKSYVAVVDSGKKAVTFTYVAPDRLRVQQGVGNDAVVIVQVALAGYHSSPGRPGRFTKKTENVTASQNAPLQTISSLVTSSTHVSRKGNTIRFDVSYGDATGHLLVELDGQGRIATAVLPVFDSKRKVVSYRPVVFRDYDHAPAVAVPTASAITGG